MSLPTVLMTDVIRAVDRGQAHGGAYLIDLESGRWSRVIDYTNDDIDWGERGRGRGLRGIAFKGDTVYIASSQALLVYDTEFNRIGAYHSPWLSHCHEIFLDGDDLYLTSTLFDSLLRFDTVANEYVEAIHIAVRETEVRTAAGVERRVMPTARAYDPNGTQGPPDHDVLHINQVWRHNGETLFSGVRVPMLCRLQRSDEGYEVRNLAKAPDWTHNCRPFRDGVLYNSTGRDAIEWASRDGASIANFPCPRYPDDELVRRDTNDRLARQAFGRGLCVHEDRLIIGGSSPGTVTAWDIETREIAAKVNVTMDIRNAPHGLEVWPFDARP